MNDRVLATLRLIFTRDVVELVSHDDPAIVLLGNRLNRSLVAACLDLGYGPSAWKEQNFEVSVASAQPITGEGNMNFIFDIACKGCGSFGVELSATTLDHMIIHCPDCDAVLGTIAAIKAECGRVAREWHAAHG